MRNESETRAELIDPKLEAAGWNVIEGSRIRREYKLTDGRIVPGSMRAKPLIADYVLTYKNRNVAVIEAKAESEALTEGVGQAKDYAKKLGVNYTYSSNGHGFYEISMKSGKEGEIDRFPTPEELWQRTFGDWNVWKDRFAAVPWEIASGRTPRYYQEIAVNRVTDAIAEEKQRILLTLATGTGKTTIAFQIAWKLFQSRWNLNRDGSRRPKILFLADRNILADQAFNEFASFEEDAKVRIKPVEIKKKGLPMSGGVFFTIFQTFMSGEKPYFGDYPSDFFDFIIIDECHRGGANDESSWRGILEYFSPAVQLGLTATPKRKDNVDTYKYFGEPVYVYSLKEGINDGFLTPFKVKRIKTTLDEYYYTPDDEVLEGEPEEGKIYTEKDFNRIIEIKEREQKRVEILMNEMDQTEKTLVFGATQLHALALRDLINQMKSNPDPHYCVRVTANDGALGEQYLREFQDNERTIPTILTTSQKLSTGVDARNVRNIVLMRPVNSIIEFKQIIGRGTRLFEGKEYFTIYDYVDAYHNFLDPEWDGEPVGDIGIDDEPKKKREPKEPEPPNPEPPEPKQRLRIKLRDGKVREVQHMIQTSFWSADGKPMSVQEFMETMFEEMPDYFKNEEELRRIWSDPETRREFLAKIAERGYTKENLETLQRMLDAEACDLFDVLSYVTFMTPKLTREERVQMTQENILFGASQPQSEFLQFVLTKYKEKGVEELDDHRLPELLKLRYKSTQDAVKLLGAVAAIRKTFISFQQKLYAASPV